MFGEFVTSFEHCIPGFFLWRDGQDDDLRWRDARRQHKTIVVSVRHHKRADEARAHTPAGSPPEFLFAFSVLKLNSARTRKILAEKMRGTGLDRFAVLHHCFNRQGLHRARKTLALRFFAAENRNREMIAHETLINFEHLPRLGSRFRFSLVNGMPFLPEKFARAQEQAWPHFPPNNVRPLVNQNGKIAVRLHPLRVARADNCFRSRADHKRLSQCARRL